MPIPNRPDNLNDDDNVDWLIVCLHDLFEREKNKEYWKGVRTGVIGTLLVSTLFVQPQQWVKNCFGRKKMPQIQTTQVLVTEGSTPVAPPTPLVRHNAVSNVVHKVIAQVNTQ
ncbi:MAG: hypothetical protein ILP11_03405 [Alphaproteobacteria bacterium]|nr:hypothetical protein [Alphaproteobacteria bacterium]